MDCVPAITKSVPADHHRTYGQVIFETGIITSKWSLYSIPSYHVCLLIWYRRHRRMSYLKDTVHLCIRVLMSSRRIKFQWIKNHLKGWSEIEAVHWRMRHLSHMDINIRDTSSESWKQPHDGVVFSGFGECDQNIAGFRGSRVFPKFGGQDKLPGLLETPCEKKEERKKCSQTHYVNKRNNGFQGC